MVIQDITEILHRHLTQRAADYAETLMEHGFTVYVAVHDRNADGAPIRQDWFHYSRDANGRTCYGTFTIGYFGSGEHAMPVRPTRQYGSSIVVTGMPNTYSIAAAERIARPQNVGLHTGLRTFDNAKPWGIGEHYVDVRTLLNEQSDD